MNALKGLAVLFFTVFLCLPGAAFGRRSLVTQTAHGRPFLYFDIYDRGEEFGSVKFDLEGEVSAWTMGSGHVSVLKNASDYWSALWGTAPRNSSPVRVVVGTIDEPGAGAQPGYALPPDTELMDALLKGSKRAEPAALIQLGFFSASPRTDYFGPMSVLPANGGSAHLASALAHELGHAMGMFSSIGFVEPDNGRYRFGDNLSAWDEHLVDSFGNKLIAGMEVYQGSVADAGAFVLDDTNYDPYAANFGGNAYFQGPQTMQALGGEGVILPGHNVPGLPISGFEPYLDAEGNFTDFPELSHIELRNSLMSHQYYRNWGILMEAELAVLQDIGLPVDRKNFFGASVHTDGNNRDLNLAFYARDAQGTAYLPGVYNSAPLAVGLHVYGRWNDLTVSGEALSQGCGGVGIRVDGWENTLNIDPAARIHALGEGGAGLMISYGKGHAITQRGEVAATGPGGVGARFDFGNNIMGNDTDYRGSYIHSYAGGNGELLEDLLYDEVNGPLVSAFNLTGTLAGGAAAMYISENAYVENIHIMRGARLFGDIISQWDPDSEHIQYAGDRSALHTSLTFGLTPDAAGRATGAADADFFLDYRGDISGAKSVDLTLAGGTLTYGGAMDVASFTAASGTTLLAPAPGARISAPEIAFTSGSTVGLANNSFTYGAPLPSTWELLRLDDKNGQITWEAAIDDTPKDFSHGFHDYASTSLTWDGSRKALILGSTRTLSRERAAEAALTAPTAIALQKPYSDLIRRRNLLSRTEEYLSADYAAWATPTLSYSRRGGETGYSLNTPGLAMGADRAWPRATLGAGIHVSTPVYRSDHADIEAQSTVGFIYGSMFSKNLWELGGFAAFDHTRYDQRRSVHDERYDTRYASDSLSAGLSLEKLLLLGPGIIARPFVSYAFTHLRVDGYNEGAAGLYGLQVSPSRADFSRLEAGTRFTASITKPGSSFDLFGRNRTSTGRVEAGIFYSGLYGDRQTRTDIAMTRDPSACTLKSGSRKHDKHSLGLSLGLALELENVTLGTGYTLRAGPATQDHQAEMTLSISF